FVLPSTLPNYIASTKLEKVDENADAVKEAVANVQGITKRLMSVKGTKSVDHYQREHGKIVWDYCGMSRTAEGLEKALTLIPELEADFWENVRVTGTEGEINQELEKAGRLVDYFGIGKLMCLDALERNESCGGHFREEYQTPEGEALRNDEEYSYVAAWQYAGDDQTPLLHKEQLTFETVKLATRSYK
ncbi:MAG: fumarate reductase/succinate dehydrogenase flavoprotein subunit, partial [Caldilinea sp.]|nr:fumarate reductase/succinate dehydrogenase flavoprotein subunit [Caldilinea sp.]